MKKIAVVLIAALVALSGALIADTVYTNFAGQVVTVNATTGIATVSVAGGTAAAATYGPYYAQAVTNGQDVTLVPDTVNVLTSYGKASLETNTITVATFASASVGKVIWVFNAAASTNLLAIAQSGNYDGPAIVLAAGQGTAIFVAGTTSVLGQ